MPLVEFAINDSASSLGPGCTPFYADRGQHPRRPLNPPAGQDPAAPAGSGEAAATLMGRVTAEVRALLQERQDGARRSSTLIAGTCSSQRETKCSWTRNIRRVPRGRCYRRFKLLARTAPNTYRLDVPATWRTCAEFNAERLQQYLCRPDHLGGEAAPPPPGIGEA